MATEETEEAMSNAKSFAMQGMVFDLWGVKHQATDCPQADKAMDQAAALELDQAE
jgi:hypothetical protein